MCSFCTSQKSVSMPGFYRKHDVAGKIKQSCRPQRAMLEKQSLRYICCWPGGVWKSCMRNWAFARLTVCRWKTQETSLESSLRGSSFSSMMLSCNKQTMMLLVLYPHFSRHFGADASPRRPRCHAYNNLHCMRKLVR